MQSNDSVDAADSSNSGFPSQLEKICFDSSSENCLAGSGLGFKKYDMGSPRSKCGRVDCKGTKIPGETKGKSQRAGIYYWVPKFCGKLVEKSQDRKVSVCPDTIALSSVPKKTGRYSHYIKTGFTMVGRHSECWAESVVGTPRCSDCNLDRCLKFRMGRSSCFWSINMGNLESVRKEPTYKFEGSKSSQVCVGNPTDTCKSIDCGNHRQCSYSICYKKLGLSEVKTSNQGSEFAAGLVRKEQLAYRDNTSSFINECGGGCVIPR